MDLDLNLKVKICKSKKYLMGLNFRSAALNEQKLKNHSALIGFSVRSNSLGLFSLPSDGFSHSARLIDWFLIEFFRSHSAQQKETFSLYTCWLLNANWQHLIRFYLLHTRFFVFLFSFSAIASYRVNVNMCCNQYKKFTREIKRRRRRLFMRMKNLFNFIYRAFFFEFSFSYTKVSSEISINFFNVVWDFFYIFESL